VSFDNYGVIEIEFSELINVPGHEDMVFYETIKESLSLSYTPAEEWKGK